MRLSRLIACIVLSSAAATMSLHAQQEPPVMPTLALEELLDKEGQIWVIDAKEFIRLYGSRGFRWASQDDQTAVRATHIPMTFLGVPVIDVTARFDGGASLSELEFLVHSRGDLGDIPESEFREKVRQTETAVKSLAEGAPKKMPAVSREFGVEQRILVWTAGPHRLKTDCSYTRGGSSRDFTFRAEYLRVFCQSVKSARRYDSTIQQRATPGVIAVGRLRDRVKKGINGDVYIDGIPMVDQGQKGYCAVATAERSLRYFGRELDQHALAQLANTSAQLGTDTAVMIDVLRKISGQYDCLMKVYEDVDTDWILTLVDKHNRIARKDGKPEIQLMGRRVSLTEIYHEADRSILWEVRMNPRTKFTNFMKIVQENIAQGYPMQWSVIIGLVPETPPINGAGGHMRLIIGYNDKTAELLYSDTWGPGHESKRMKAEDAWPITTGLYMIRPRSSM